MRAQLFGQWKIIAQCLEQSRDPVVRYRLSALALIACGYPVGKIAKRLKVTRQTLYNWEERLLHGQFRPESLSDPPRSGRPSQWNSQLTRVLEASLQYRPCHFGYSNVNWTVGLLRDHLAKYGGLWFSDDTVRRQLHHMGYAWKRARYALKPDPDKAKKKRDQETLAIIA